MELTLLEIADAVSKNKYNPVFLNHSLAASEVFQTCFDAHTREEVVIGLHTRLSRTACSSSTS